MLHQQLSHCFNFHLFLCNHYAKLDMCAHIHFRDQFQHTPCLLHQGPGRVEAESVGDFFFVEDAVQGVLGDTLADVAHLGDEVAGYEFGLGADDGLACSDLLF